MKRITALALASTLTIGLATVFVANSYGFLWFGKDKSKKYEKTTFMVQGMTCDGCESSVASALEKIDGVKCAKVDHTTGKAEVCFEKKAKVEALSAAIVAAGYTVSGAEAGVCGHGASDGAGCAGMKGATKAEGARCCAAGAGAKSASSEAGATCAFKAAPQASADGDGCAHGVRAADHVAGCARAADVKATSPDVDGEGAATKIGGSCTHGAEAAKGASAPKGQKS